MAKKKNIQPTYPLLDFIFAVLEFFLQLFLFVTLLPLQLLVGAIGLVALVFGFVVLGGIIFLCAIPFM